MTSKFADVLEWLMQSDPVFDKKEIKTDLLACYDSEAYRFCTNLERKAFWVPNAELCDILVASKKEDFE